MTLWSKYQTIGKFAGRETVRDGLGNSPHFHLGGSWGADRLLSTVMASIGPQNGKQIRRVSYLLWYV